MAHFIMGTAYHEVSFPSRNLRRGRTYILAPMRRQLIHKGRKP